jgi:hypothetical protein
MIELNLRELIGQMDPTDMRRAVALVETGAVKDLKATPSRFIASVEENGRIYLVEVLPLDVEENARASCSCGLLNENHLCVHLTAVMITLSDKLEMSPEDEDIDEEYEDESDDDLSFLEDFNFSAPHPQTGVSALPEQLWPQPGLKEIEQDYRKLVEALNVKQAREMAALRGISLSGLKREGLLDQFAQGLAKPEILAAALEHLPEDCQRVLWLILLLGQRLMARSSTPETIPYLTAALEPFLPTRPVMNCLEDLNRLGLIFMSNGVFRVPIQVWALHATQPALFKTYTGHIDAVEQAKPYQFSRLALHMALLAQSGFLELTPLSKNKDYSGWPLQPGERSSGKDQAIPHEISFLSDARLRQISRDLVEPKTKVDFIARVLELSGFWEGHNPAQLGEAFTRWLQLDPGAQCRMLFKNSIFVPSTFELDEARSAVGFTIGRGPNSPSRDEFMNGLIADRRRLMELLACAPAGQWLDLDVLLRTVHGLQPYWMPELYMRSAAARRKDFAFTPTTWIQVNGRALNLLDYPLWVKTFGNFYIKVITQTFTWLGLVDTAWENKRPVACRVSKFGEYLLERTHEFPAADGSQKKQALYITSSSKFELDAGLADPDLINLVLLIGKPGTEKAAPAAVRRLEYEINPVGVEHAFESGWTAEKIQQVLERGLSGPLPGEWRQDIQTLWERYGRLHLYTQVALIKFADDYCLPELLANTSLNKILLYTFSPRVIAVRPDGVMKLVEELCAKGHTPRLEGNQHASTTL